MPERVSLTGLAAGGAAVGRLPDGRAVFVGHAVPGEVVDVEVVESRRRWARADLVDIIEPSPDRVTPPCPYFAPHRCGGCVLQHIAPERRHTLLRQVVVDQLQRLGGIGDPTVDAPVAAGEYHYRSRARFGVDHEGRLGFRQSGTHQLIPIERCWLLDEATAAAHRDVARGWHGVAEVEVRTGSEGAAVVAFFAGPATGVAHPETDMPIVLATRRRGGGAPGDGTITERVAGTQFRVSPLSFFQSNRAGAETLVDLVVRRAGVGAGDAVLDLYSGVGLFARALAGTGATVTAVEGSRSSAMDAEFNLATYAEVVRDSVEHTLAVMRDHGRRTDVTVLDPPRKGAGRDVISAIGEITTRTIVYVACDPAALARDAATLADLDWELQRATPVDQFAQTASIEVVATFTRG